VEDYSTWVVSRNTTSETFGTPQSVTDVFHASISRDGLSLYGNKAGAYGHMDIYILTRPSTDAAWGTPQLLDSNVNTSLPDRWCEISPDGLELYFTRGDDSWDIWVSQRLDNNEPFGSAAKLPENINDGTSSAPALSDDGLTMFFSSLRDGGYGGDDVWASTRAAKDSPWGEPFNLGPEVNTNIDEWAPEISSDGRTLYFSRTTLDPLDYQIWEVDIVPEPSTMALLVVGGLVLGTLARRR
jgi:hypothetical protein